MPSVNLFCCPQGLFRKTSGSNPEPGAEATSPPSPTPLQSVTSNEHYGPPGLPGSQEIYQRRNSIPSSLQRYRMEQSSPAEQTFKKRLEQLDLPLESAIASDALLGAVRRDGNSGREVIRLDEGRITARHEPEYKLIRVYVGQSQEVVNINLSQDGKTVHGITGHPEISPEKLHDLVNAGLLNRAVLESVGQTSNSSAPHQQSGSSALQASSAEMKRFRETYSYDAVFDKSNKLADAFSKTRNTFERIDPERTTSSKKSGQKFFLGGGEHGKVRLAYDRVHERMVAIKSATVGARYAGYDEGELLGRIKSPYVVELYDAVKVVKGGREKRYIAMECGGLTLFDLMKEGHRFTQNEIADMVNRVLHGVLDCFDAQVVLDDIKLANILMTDTGVKLMDFNQALDVNDAENWKSRMGYDYSPENACSYSLSQVVGIASKLIERASTGPISAEALHFSQLQLDDEDLQRNISLLKEHPFLAQTSPDAVPPPAATQRAA